ncbi:hypothetical protein PI126_g12522 [Phytophthora idaei]|nr:hypothetical protein PI126_g12522 [Phytophthora idaei]
MENASKWWVDMNRRLSEHKRTWTFLKKALLRRYGEKLDKAAAEWRVSIRRMMPGESHADFAVGLRGVVGRNKVSERVLLAQFYRCLDKTTKKLVKQDPKPRTLEESVVAGCTEEFLIGVDVMQRHGATMDFERNEIENGRTVVVPFRRVMTRVMREWRRTGAVMLAATITTARNGKALLPAINANNKEAKLPGKKELYR